MQLKDARVTVMGLGQFGGGLGVTRWLLARGARVLLTDRDPRERLERPLAELAEACESGAVTLRLGGHDERDFADADLVVANPAVPVPWDNAYLRAAREAGTPVTTEIRLAVDELDRDRTVAVTGSAGKSSTSSMIALLLDDAPRTARLGGNIGGSLLGAAARPGEWTVLELSSAMLWWLGEGAAWAGLEPWSARVAVLTNLAPNHVDWHGSLTHYMRSKAEIRRHQRAGDAEGAALVARVGERAEPALGHHGLGMALAGLDLLLTIRANLGLGLDGRGLDLHYLPALIRPCSLAKSKTAQALAHGLGGNPQDPADLGVGLALPAHGQRGPVVVVGPDQSFRHALSPCVEAREGRRE